MENIVHANTIKIYQHATYQLPSALNLLIVVRNNKTLLFFTKISAFLKFLEFVLEEQ